MFYFILFYFNEHVRAPDKKLLNKSNRRKVVSPFSEEKLWWQDRSGGSDTFPLLHLQGKFTYLQTAKLPKGYDVDMRMLRSTPS